MDLPLKPLCYLFFAFFVFVILLVNSPSGTLKMIISGSMVKSLDPGFETISFDQVSPVFGWIHTFALSLSGI